VGRPYTLIFIVIWIIGGASALIFHAKFPCDRILLLFTMSRLDFAGEFRREG
jgi:hypothetical protein